jgi:hypothetical protein
MSVAGVVVPDGLLVLASVTKRTCFASGPEGVDVDDALFELGVESSQYHRSSGAEALCDAGGDDVHESYAHVQDLEELFFAAARQAFSEASRQLRLEDARGVALARSDGLDDEGLRVVPPFGSFLCLGHGIRGGWWTGRWRSNSPLSQVCLIRAIAREFHMSPAGVRYHRQRLQRGPPLREPINTPERNIGPKVSKEQLKTIRARRRPVRKFAIEKVASTGRKKYTSVAKIAAALQFNKGIVVSRTTVHEDMLAMGYSSKARRQQPVLTAEKMLKRVQFARCPPSGAVLFSDECCCGGTVEGKNEWVTEDEEPAPQEQF